MLASLGEGGDAVAERATQILTRETRDFLVRNARVLESLRGRVRTGILSNFSGNLEVILGEEGLLALVDQVFDSGVVGIRKPDPEFFRHALRRLGASPDRSAMVGDSIEMDLRPARGVGLCAIWVRGAEPRETDFAPDFVLESVRDFPGIWAR